MLDGRPACAQQRTEPSNAFLSFSSFSVAHQERIKTTYTFLCNLGCPSTLLSPSPAEIVPAFLPEMACRSVLDLGRPCSRRSSLWLLVKSPNVADHIDAFAMAPLATSRKCLWHALYPTFDFIF